MAKDFINLIQTEIGLFPADWSIIRVKDLFSEIKRGYVLPVSATKSRPSGDSIYPVYSSQTANNGVMGFYDKYLFEDAITWTTDGANAGDVNFRKGRFYCTNVCGVLISNIGFANRCTAEAINRVSRNYVSYIGNPKLMNNVMAEIQIAIPPTLEEQLRIGRALSTIDAYIKSVDDAILKKRQIKEGLMQQLLTGTTRLPGFSGEWKEILFKSIYKYAKEGGTPSTGVAEYYNPATAPFAKIEDLKEKYLTRVESYISESGVEHSSAWLIPVNSVILSNGATLGEVSINKIPTTTKQGILGIILKEEYSPEFIYYLFKGRTFRREMEKVTTHGTMDCAYLKDLNTISLRIPSMAEQEAIASVIASVDNEIVGLESQRDKYALIKQGMMQELLTGKTRLK